MGFVSSDAAVREEAALLEGLILFPGSPEVNLVG